MFVHLRFALLHKFALKLHTRLYIINKKNPQTTDLKMGDGERSTYMQSSIKFKWQHLNVCDFSLRSWFIVKSLRMHTQMPTVYVSCLLNTQLIFPVSRSSCGPWHGTKARLKNQGRLNFAHLALVNNEDFFWRDFGVRIHCTVCFVLLIAVYLWVMLLTSNTRTSHQLPK